MSEADQQLLEEVMQIEYLNCDKIDESTQLRDMLGHWRLLLNESDSCDSVLEACGISRFKQVMFRSFVTETWIENAQPDQTDENGNPVDLRIRTALPTGGCQEIVLKMNGSPVEFADGYTQDKWTTTSVWQTEQHTLMVKRVGSSSRGVHYDMRRVFKDGALIGFPGKKVMLFRWVVKPSDGEVRLANRWLIRVD